ncbi:MAG: beta-N-acetylhexosaminidase, partial [Candidatus Tectomicrobia bacterium]|nr:beta-N-acetylhexosaminidase [Candidatus Tectomicrobia bacterium]
DIDQLALEVKLGQSLILGFEGTHLTQSLKELLEICHIGGVILFSRNYSSPLQLKKLCFDLQHIASQNAPYLPLIISIDQEGGRVCRLREPFTHFPSANVLGKMSDEKLVVEVARATAKELEAVGINTNLAPVLDLATNHLNRVIGDRSFGEKMSCVSRLGAAYIKGLHSGGVLSVAKHFPGHGDTFQDSHLGLPTSWQLESLLRTREMEPFRMASLAGVDAVMTAHVIYPEVERENPATLSEYIIGDLLRKGCSFYGPVMSDDLLMSAISSLYSLPEGALRAYKAGVDMLLISKEEDKGISVYQALLRAAKRGELTEDRINGATYNILSMKRKIKWPEKATVDASSLGVIGCQEHKDLVAKVLGS